MDESFLVLFFKKELLFALLAEVADSQSAEGRGFAFKLGGFAVEDGGAGFGVGAHAGGAECIS